MSYALLAGLARVLSAVSTFAMWDARQNGPCGIGRRHRRSRGYGTSGLLCILLARQLPGVEHSASDAGCCGRRASFAVYVLAEPFRRWWDTTPRTDGL